MLETAAVTEAHAGPGSRVTAYCPVHKIFHQGHLEVVEVQGLCALNGQAGHLVGGFLVAKEVYLQSLSKTGGSIVNMLADMWGGMPGMGHSGAARAGMENFTKTAAYEWGHSGVRVNAVAPGWIASSGMDTYPESMKNMIRNLKDHVPLQRIGTESEVAAAIVFLLTPGANFISGNTIRIDGAASQGTRAWTLGKAKSSESYNGFHRAYLPDVFKE